MLQVKKKHPPQESNSQVGKFYSNDCIPNNNDISLPDEITKLSDTCMRNLHARIVAWLGYRQTQLINSTIALNELKSTISIRAAQIHAGFSQADKWRFEYICKRDAQWKDLNSQVISKESEVTALGIEIDKLEKRAMVLSREQSYREKMMMSRT